MALRSVFSIDVDDSKFKKFKEQFDKYQEALKKLPNEWKSINNAAEGAAAAALGMEEHFRNSEAHVKRQARNLSEITQSVSLASKTWSGITSAISKTNDYIGKATSSLVKWSTVTTVLSGLLGVGALFGIDRLAASINAQRRSAMGLGISYGQQAAFNSNYNQIINPGSLLSNISTAKYNATTPEYRSLLAAGITKPQIDSENVADLASDLLQPNGPLEKLFKGVPQGLIGAKAHAMGVDQLMPMGDLVSFLNASPEEKARLAKQYAADAKQMDLKEDAQRKWADLKTQLDRATDNIKSVFGEDFAQFAPKIQKISDLFVQAIAAFAKTPLLDEWLDDLSGGLENFATYIGTDDFQTEVNNFVKWVGDAATSVYNFVTSFGGQLPSMSSAKAATTFPAPTGAMEGAGGGGGYSGGGGGGSSSTPLASAFPAVSGSPLVAPPISGPSTWKGVKVTPGDNYSMTVEGMGTFPNTPEGHLAFDRANAKRIGLNPDFAAGVAYTEGANNYAKGPAFASRVDIDPDGTPFTYGDYQLNIHKGQIGDLARSQGIDPANPNDWVKANMFAQDYMLRHGIAPWNRDKTLEEWRSAGKLPTIYVMPQTGANVARSSAMVTDPFSIVGSH